MKKSLLVLLLSCTLILIFVTPALGTPAKNTEAPNWAALYAYQNEELDHPRKDHPYMFGYADGSFRPDALLTRAETATIMARAKGKNDKAEVTAQFYDLPVDHWANANVAVLSREGILTGYLDGSFLPDKHISRAEFVAIACRLASKSPGFVNNGYADVAGHWAAGYIYTAQGEGWLADFAGMNFNPDKAITRGEAVQILNRALGRDKMTFVTKVADFTDVPSTHPLYDAIMRAASEMR